MLFEALPDLARTRPLVRINEVTELELSLITFRLQADPRHIRHALAETQGVPAVIN